MPVTAIPSALTSSTELQSHHDALLGQWKRAKQLRDFPTLRALGATKGLDVIKSVSLGAQTYKVFRGSAKRAKLLTVGDLVTIGAFVDKYSESAQA